MHLASDLDLGLHNFEQMASNMSNWVVDFVSSVWTLGSGWPWKSNLCRMIPTKMTNGHVKCFYMFLHYFCLTFDCTCSWSVLESARPDQIVLIYSKPGAQVRDLAMPIRSTVPCWANNWREKHAQNKTCQSQRQASCWPGSAANGLWGKTDAILAPSCTLFKNATKLRGSSWSLNSPRRIG